MNLVKKLFGALAIVVSLSMGNAAHAGIPVIDATSVAQQIQQVLAWGKQYAQMLQQLNQLEQQYTNMSGARGMGSLVNNPLSRQYLPPEYQTILSNGVGQSTAIRNAAKKFDVSSTSLSGLSDSAQAFNQLANQAAINRAGAEEGYKSASQRFGDIQVLLDKVNNAPDAKDIADLQGRIQAEQLMLQNESNKLQALQQLANAQRDLQIQQAREIGMKSINGGLAPGW